MSNLGKWIAGLAAAIIAPLVVWILTRPGGLINPVPPTPTTNSSIGRPNTNLLPNVTGMLNVDAYRGLRAANFNVREIREPSTTIGPCHVIWTDPAPNNEVSPGLMVHIHVSSGPPPVPGQPVYGCPPMPSD